MKRPKGIPQERWEALSAQQQSLLVFYLRHPSPSISQAVPLAR